MYFIILIFNRILLILQRTYISYNLVLLSFKVFVYTVLLTIVDICCSRVIIYLFSFSYNSLSRRTNNLSVYF
nr:MAG TPA: hypothetical protein [Caudoviricetes sp.]